MVWATMKKRNKKKKKKKKKNKTIEKKYKKVIRSEKGWKVSLDNYQ